jgi:tetratricopeptide (TPR) repeat protein
VYVFARSTLLAAFFALLCIRDWQRGRFWRSAAWFALSMLAKEEVAALPLVLALAEWSVDRLRNAARPLAAMLVTALLIGGRAAWAVSTVAGSGAGSQSGYTPFEYLSFQGVAILRYLWLLLVPIGFTPDPAIRTGPWQASLAWGVIAAVFVLSLSGARGLRPGFYLLAGLLLLLPSSSIFPAEDLAADRRMYLPLLFFGPLLGLLLQRADSRLLSALAVIWCGASFFQTRLWQNPHALWMEAARLSPETIRAKRQLAALLPAPQAVELLNEAARLRPEDAAIPSDIGMAWLRAGDPAQALEAFGRALAIDPGSAIHTHNRGLALLLLGQSDAARADFERALELDPCLFDALWNLRRLGVIRVTPPGCRYTPERGRKLATSAPSP